MASRTTGSKSVRRQGRGQGRSSTRSAQKPKKVSVRKVSRLQPVRALPRGVEASASRILSRERSLKGRTAERTFLQFQKDFLGVQLPRQKIQIKRLTKPENARRLAAHFSPRTTKKYEYGIRTDQARTFANRSTSATRKRVKFVSRELRSIAVGRKRNGEVLQRIFQLDLVIASDSLKVDLSKDDVENPNTDLSSVSNLVNQYARRQLLEAMIRRRRIPAYIQFYLTGITPGNKQESRRLVTYPTQSFTRHDLDPDPRRPETFRFFLEYNLSRAMERLNTSILQTFVTSPGEFFTVLKIATEVAFDSKPQARAEYELLKRERKFGHLKRIVQGSKRIRELEKRYG